MVIRKPPKGGTTYRLRAGGAALVCVLTLVCRGEDDLLQNAATASAPATLTAPEPIAPAKPPAEARLAAVVLSDGAKLHGQLWTTTATPFRVWVEESKVYKDIELDQIARIEVKVLAQTMEDDWRWLKEGSDQKIYSGKKYPLVSMMYRFTLADGKAVEGTLAAPVYLLEEAKGATQPGKPRALVLNQKLKGAPDQTLKDLAYIESIVFDSVASQPARTTKLPLLPD